MVDLWVSYQCWCQCQWMMEVAWTGGMYSTPIQKMSNDKDATCLIFISYTLLKILPPLGITSWSSQNITPTEISCLYILLTIGLCFAKQSIRCESLIMTIYQMRTTFMPKMQFGYKLSAKMYLSFTDFNSVSVRAESSPTWWFDHQIFHVWWARTGAWKSHLLNKSH